MIREFVKKMVVGLLVGHLNVRGQDIFVPGLPVELVV